MSDKGSLSHLTNIVSSRSKAFGLNLSSKQAFNVPSNLKSEYVVLPSTSAPAFGSFFIFDIKDKNIILSDLIIQFNCSAITGVTTPPTNFPHFVPAFFFCSKIEVIINNVCIDTYYPLQQFIANQFGFHDEDRLLFNNLAGSYASVAQRFTLNAAGSNYYLKLRSVFGEIHMPLLNESHQVQLRCYVDTLTNVVAVSSGGGTAAATINFANLICKVMKLPTELALSRLQQMNKAPEHNIYHSLRYAPFGGIAANTTTQTFIMTPFVGSVVAIFFVVRPVANLNRDESYQFTPIKDFQLLDGTSSNMNGGTVINSQVALNFLNSYNCKSSYPSEVATSVNLAGAVNDNKANVYCFSFSSNLVSALQEGILLGSKRFQGNEQLIINFNAALAAPQLDVFCYTQSVLEQGGNYVKIYKL